MKIDNWKLKINVMELPENNIEYDDSQSPKNNKFLILGLFVGLAIVFLIPGIFFLTRMNQALPQNQDYQPQPPSQTSQPENNMSPKANLYFNPTTLSLDQNESQPLVLTVDTSGYQATAVEVYFRFDPSYLEVESVKPAAFFTQPNILQQKIDNDTGLVFLALGTFSPKAGSGDLITFNIKAKNLSGQTEVSLTPDTKMAAKGETGNILGETKTLSVEVN